MTQDQLKNYVDEGVAERGGVARKRALEEVDLGTFKIGKEVKLAERVETITAVLELEGNDQPEDWKPKDDHWIQVAWQSAIDLRSGKK